MTLQERDALFVHGKIRYSFWHRATNFEFDSECELVFDDKGEFLETGTKTFADGKVEHYGFLHKGSDYVSWTDNVGKTQVRLDTKGHGARLDLEDFFPVEKPCRAFGLGFKWFYEAPTSQQGDTLIRTAAGGQIRLETGLDNFPKQYIIEPRKPGDTGTVQTFTGRVQTGTILDVPQRVRTIGPPGTSSIEVAVKSADLSVNPVIGLEALQDVLTPGTEVTDFRSRIPVLLPYETLEQAIPESRSPRFQLKRWIRR